MACLLAVCDWRCAEGVSTRFRPRFCCRELLRRPSFLQCCPLAIEMPGMIVFLYFRYCSRYLEFCAAHADGLVPVAAASA
jgi:hypothetical protein